MFEVEFVEVFVDCGVGFFVVVVVVLEFCCDE